MRPIIEDELAYEEALEAAMARAVTLRLGLRTLKQDINHALDLLPDGSPASKRELDEALERLDRAQDIEHILDNAYLSPEKR